MQNSLSNQIVGMWQVIAFDDRKDEHSPWLPHMGEHPIGFLQYDLTGFMSIQIMKIPPPAPFPIEDGNFIVNEEGAKATQDGFVAYFGRYSIEKTGEVVIHHIVGSLLPNSVDTNQERKISIEDDRLIFGDGNTWKRVLKRVG